MTLEIIDDPALASRARLVIHCAAEIAHMMMRDEDYGPRLRAMETEHKFPPSYLPMYAEMYKLGWEHAKEEDNG